MSQRHVLAGVLAALALGLAACGGGDQKDPSAIDGDPGTPLPAALQSQRAPAPRNPNTPLPTTDAVENVSTNLNVKPRLGTPSGDPPNELAGIDVTPGTGARVKDGDEVEVQYVGVLFRNGTQFDTSWRSDTRPGGNLTFTVGEGGVIRGWDEGVIGMRVGMRRVLVIPSELAYGQQGSPPAIGPDEPLVFAIDLKKIG